MIHAPARRCARPRGFTLTEILIVLVIAALLAGFGLPALLRYNLHGKLASAEALLKRIAAQEDVWFAGHKKYATLNQLGYPLDSSLAAVYLSDDGSVDSSAHKDSIYRVSISLAAPSASSGGDSAYFLITAQPLNRQARDTSCATLSLASTGQVGASGTLGEAECWEK